MGMTDRELNEIEARLRRATPAPWVPDDSFIRRWHTTGDVMFVAERPATASDVIFIAHAPEDVKALLREVKRLRGAQP